MAVEKWKSRTYSFRGLLLLLLLLFVIGGVCVTSFRSLTHEKQSARYHLDTRSVTSTRASQPVERLMERKHHPPGAFFCAFFPVTAAYALRIQTVTSSDIFAFSTYCLREQSRQMIWVRACMYFAAQPVKVTVTSGSRHTLML